MSQCFARCWQAYRAAALRHHPDKNKGDVEGAKAKFQAAKDARDLLSDAKARAALDALLGCAIAEPQCGSANLAGYPACLQTGHATSPGMHSEFHKLTVHVMGGLAADGDCQPHSCDCCAGRVRRGRPSLQGRTRSGGGCGRPWSETRKPQPPAAARRPRPARACRSARPACTLHPISAAGCTTWRHPDSCRALLLTHAQQPVWQRQGCGSMVRWRVAAFDLACCVSLCRLSSGG